MPIMEATRALKTWTGTYDFALDGGGVGALLLRSDDGPLPLGSVIVSGYLDVTVACLSATGTMAIEAEGAGDVLAAAGQAALTTGRKDIVPDATGTTAVKTTAERRPTVMIATAAFTAGAFTLVLIYR